MNKRRRRIEPDRIAEIAPESSAYRRALEVYGGSDGEATKALYEELIALVPAGLVAMNLFRTLKNSERAKSHRGGNARGSYRQQAYDRKHWSIEQLCKTLRAHSGELGLDWGWAVDPIKERHRDVIYVDLPTGQISFHTEPRVPDCPNYSFGWDGVPGVAPFRLCKWIGRLFGDSL